MTRPGGRQAVTSAAVAGCCNSRGCEWFFGDRFARRVAKRYRKRGLDKPSQRIVDFIASRGVEGATVLEIGGGLGEIQLELVKRGAARTINLELSPAYDRLARQLARDAGVEDRVERRLHDIAVDPDGVEAVDIVVLNRVVCCYPDYERLLGAAAGHVRRLLVFSYPPGTPVWRAIAGLQNLAFRLLGKEFRAFAHPPDAMFAVLERQGLRRTFAQRGVPFSVAGLET
jgi:hypothetical protein